jgi:asparagine synthase (glutamine-hydrolysing)
MRRVQATSRECHDFGINHLTHAVGSLAVVRSAAVPAGHEAVERALRAAPHRGNDLQVAAADDVALGISNDPGLVDAWLASRDGRVAAVTGSLDNLAELGLGGGDPAEAVLAAFATWGAEAPARLRGVYAGAWTDGRDLVVFRDHLGLAPLFHRESPDGFVAATEGKQVAAGAGIAREPDVESVEAMFFGRFDARRTMLRGVDRFPRASTATIGPGGEARFGRYWDPERLLETARIGLPEARERLAELLERAVGRSLTGADAISLSGGIDSPVIAAFAAPRTAELTGAPLLAVSSVYPEDPGVDESRWIELVSDHLGLRLHAYTPSSRPLDDAERWVDVLDGPVDTMSIPELAENYRLARELGARSVLTGEMAEWVFTFGQHLIGHLVLHGRARPALAWARDQRARGASWRRLAKRAGPSLASPRVALGYRRLRGREDFRQLPPWVDREVAGSPGPRPDLARPARRRWLEHQLDPLVGVGLYSFDADALCAAVCGVHVRRPLVDVDLWEFVLSLPAEVKFPDAVPKSLLRESVRGRLPDELLDRTDKTFFNDFALRTADYVGIRRLALDSELRIEGVDYALLADRVAARDMDVVELLWAYDLARAHAFLGLWA